MRGQFGRRVPTAWLKDGARLHEPTQPRCNGSGTPRATAKLRSFLATLHPRHQSGSGVELSTQRHAVDCNDRGASASSMEMYLKTRLECRPPRGFSCSCNIPNPRSGCQATRETLCLQQCPSLQAHRQNNLLHWTHRRRSLFPVHSMPSKQHSFSELARKRREGVCQPLCVARVQSRLQLFPQQMGHASSSP